MSPDSIIISDDEALLRRYWENLLRQSPDMPNLAPDLQAKALADAMEAEHPKKAAIVRDWNPIRRGAKLAMLMTAPRKEPLDAFKELWRLRSGDREVRCIAVYVSNGVDLRLVQGGVKLRAELFVDVPLLRVRSKQWRESFEAEGWSE